jgi:hypothetical protein
VKTDFRCEYSIDDSIGIEIFFKIKNIMRWFLTIVFHRRFIDNFQ